MSFVGPFLVAGAVILIYMITLWLVSLALRNSSIVDIFWGLGFVVAAWAYHALAVQVTARAWLLLAMVTMWGLRLSFYILWRNWGKPEDFRYAKWRGESGGRWWWKSLFQVFLLQGLLLWIISAPLLAAQLGPAADRLTWLDGIALGVWLIGFIFESAGDFQLARFRADPTTRGTVLRTGVWRYTRHPNYFGDATQWWGLLPARARGRRLVDGLQPAADDTAAPACLRRQPAREVPRGDEARLSRLRRKHQRLHPVDSEAPPPLGGVHKEEVSCEWRSSSPCSACWR